MTDLLNPVFAAQLAKRLFPDMSPIEALPEVVQWYENYLKEFTVQPPVRSTPPGFRRTPAPAPVPKSVFAPAADPAPRSWTASDLQGEQPEENGDSLKLHIEESPEGLMQAFLAYVKESKKGASDLSRMAEVSYPTMLTWLKGVKVPRGQNIQKLQAFLAKVKSTEA
jgi:hypothetical protein